MQLKVNTSESKHFRLYSKINKTSVLILWSHSQIEKLNLHHSGSDPCTLAFCTFDCALSISCLSVCFLSALEKLYNLDILPRVIMSVGEFLV